MYGRLSRRADNLISAVLLIAGLALLALAVRSATNRSFTLPLAFAAACVGGLRLWNPRHVTTVVESVQQSHVEVLEGETVGRRALSALGGRRGFFFPWQWRFAAPDKPALAKVFTALRDAGVHFVSEGGHNWGPAEVFDQLRDDGLVSGPCKKYDAF